MFTIECCLSDVNVAGAVAGAGADRVELNRRLDIGGLTPSVKMVHALLQSAAIPVICMVRPRGGGFVYDAAEYAAMQADVDAMLEAGAAGIAFGILDAGGRVDVARCRAIVEGAGGNQVVFHRAFDEAADPFEALEALVDLGVRRILTSGQAATAMEGTTLIRRLIERADGRIEILPGAGINAGNVRAIIETTGCTQVHGTFRSRESGRPSNQPPDGTAIEQVKAVRCLLDELANRSPSTGS